MVWIAFWLLGLVGILADSIPTLWRQGGVSGVVWLIAFTGIVCGPPIAVGAYLFLWHLFGNERVLIKCGRVHVQRCIFKCCWERVYSLGQLQSIRVVGPEPFAWDTFVQVGLAGGAIALQFEQTVVRVGIRLDLNEAEKIRQRIEAFLRTPKERCELSDSRA
jgi:hypothetical protein